MTDPTTYLTAAVIVVGALGLLNLLLLLAVLRRLRTTGVGNGGEHGPHDGHDHGTGSGAEALRGLRAGDRPEEFGVRMLHGGHLTHEDLVGQGPTLIGFFSPGCGACVAQAPVFARRAASWPGGPDRVVVVVADETEEGAEFAERFAGTARLVVDGLSGPVATAFGVTAFPSFGLLDDTATVTAESVRADGLPAQGPAPSVV